MIRGKEVKTFSEHEKIKRGIRRNFIPWDETKEAQKNTTIHSWSFFYHKPYQNDWQQAHQEAVERKLRYKHETIHDGNEG